MMMLKQSSAQVSSQQITEALQNLRLQQQQLCQRHQINYRECALDEVVALATHTLGQAPVYGMRYQPEQAGAVSWYFYCGEYSDADDFFQPIHAHHLLEVLPQVMPYLGLDYAHYFIIDDQAYEEVGLLMDADE